jgi:[ribosomal protein S18]-alanine N-acetyltransferase
MAAAPHLPADPVDSIMAVMDAAFDPAFGEAWSRRQVADALLLGTCRYALIDADGALGPGTPEPAGFYLSRSALDEEELLLLAVAPGQRGRGLGSALLDDFCSAARARGATRAFLEMRRGNPAARLYEANGFRVIGERPAYYRGRYGARYDAISFEKRLTG